jgi:hypothetical protein
MFRRLDSLRLQVKPTELGPIDRAMSSYLPISETILILLPFYSGLSSEFDRVPHNPASS